MHTRVFFCESSPLSPLRHPFLISPSGSLFPYCFSWIIYQGHLVTDLLNWAGLVVNGLIAFVFPIALCYFVFVVKPTRGMSPADRLVEEELEMSELETEREIQITQSPRSSGSSLEIPSHKALFPWLLPYRTVIISTIFVLFLTMITTTIVVNLLDLL
jgi:hypothetical protein